MTKRELVVEVAAKLGFTQNEVGNIVQDTLDTIIQALSEGHRLEIRNFGVFELKTRDARMGRNPRTGKKVAIAKKRVASFKPGKALKEWIQAGPDYAPSGLFESEPRKKPGVPPESAPTSASPAGEAAAPESPSPHTAASSSESQPGQQDLF